MALGTATFYKYEGDPRTSNKTMGNAVATSAQLHPLQSLSNLDAKLICDYQENAMSANYFECDGLYYKITNRERLTAGAMAITGTIDSLKSYWSQIVQCPCILERGALERVNSKFVDPLYPTIQASAVQVFGSASGLFSLGVDTYGNNIDSNIFAFVR